MRQTRGKLFAWLFEGCFRRIKPPLEQPRKKFSSRRTFFVRSQIIIKIAGPFGNGHRARVLFDRRCRKAAQERQANREAAQKTAKERELRARPREAVAAQEAAREAAAQRAHQLLGNAGQFDHEAAQAAPQQEAGNRTNDPEKGRQLRAEMRGSQPGKGGQKKSGKKK